MALSNDLISQFVKTTKDSSKRKSESTVYGTIVEYDGGKYARLDGSDRLTPYTATTSAKPGDRVAVLIKNHTATVTGNLSSPSAGMDMVGQLGSQIAQFDTIIAKKADINQLNVEIARIDTLTAENVTIKGQLTAVDAHIESLTADNVDIRETLTANKAIIDDLSANKLDAETADIKYATIESLKATDATIHNLVGDYGKFVDLTTDKFLAIDATITNIDAEKLSVKDADIKYANIDFSNIGQAAIEKIFSDTGLIKDLIVGDQTITGELIGVTIKGDLIEGNTIVADKLVIKGVDGLYYKLNTDGITTEAEQTDYNSLNGQVIRAKSITASQIAVNDLVAFDATIGGFNITKDAIYSGVKVSVDNTTRGIYMDDEGQIALGDAYNYIKYFKDKDGKYRLAISADSIIFGVSDTTIKDALDDMQDDIDSLRDEITTVLRIESSKGFLFKKDNISTQLSVIIYHGTERITDAVTMKNVFGTGAYLQWKWQRITDDAYVAIPSDDPRLSENGFKFTLSAEDVETKVTFICELITM